MSDLTPDWELRVQQFLDQELSPEQRLQFIVRLGRDEALRQRVIELEQLVLNASRLEPPAVPEGFAARVMERTGDARPLWRRAADVMRAPREYRWNVATAAASACLLAVVVAAMTYFGPLERRPAPGPADASPSVDQGTRSPSAVLVRLVIVKAGARTVQVAGDFNGWKPTPLSEVSDGAWAITLPIEPGRYEYMFVVDGEQWISDPFAAEQTEDGFGSRNAVLDVRPPLVSSGAPL